MAAAQTGVAVEGEITSLGNAKAAKSAVSDATNPTQHDPLPHSLHTDKQTELQLLKVVRQSTNTDETCQAVQQLLNNVHAHIAVQLLNAADPETGSTALHIAALRGDEQLTQLLGSQPGVNFNALDNLGRTPLACAVASRNNQLVAKFLLAASANSTQSNGSPMDPALHGANFPESSPIAQAIALPEPDVLRSLLHTVKLINRLSSVPSPLANAVHHANHQFAMNHNVNFNSNNSHQSLPAAPTKQIGSHGYAVSQQPTPVECGPALACGLPKLLKQSVNHAGLPPLLAALLQRKLSHASVLVGYGAPLEAYMVDVDITCNITYPTDTAISAGLAEAAAARQKQIPNSRATSPLSSPSPHSTQSKASTVEGSMPAIAPGSSSLSNSSSSASISTSCNGLTPMHVLIQYIQELEEQNEEPAFTRNSVDTLTTAATHTSLGQSFSLSRVSSSAIGSPNVLPVCTASTHNSVSRMGSLTNMGSIHGVHSSSLSTSPLTAAYELCSIMARKPAMQQAASIQDSSGNTCFHLAAAAGLTQVIAALLKGLNSPQSILRIANHSQQTALDVARVAGHMEVVQMLQDAQAPSSISCHPGSCNHHHAHHHHHHSGHARHMPHFTPHHHSLCQHIHPHQGHLLIPARSLPISNGIPNHVLGQHVHSHHLRAFSSLTLPGSPQFSKVTALTEVSAAEEQSVSPQASTPRSHAAGMADSPIQLQQPLETSHDGSKAAPHVVNKIDTSLPPVTVVLPPLAKKSQSTGCEMRTSSKSAWKQAWKKALKSIFS